MIMHVLRRWLGGVEAQLVGPLYKVHTVLAYTEAWKELVFCKLKRKRCITVQTVNTDHGQNV